jgi:Dockerin type I domain
MRPYWLLEASWGQVGPPFDPPAARCVNYQEDDVIDLFDYLALLRDWWSGCTEIGQRHPSGSCFFPGDVNRDGCLDHDDYLAIASEYGLEAFMAHPCADLSDDGFIDEIDSAFFLRYFANLACPGVEFDPTLVIGQTPPAVACDGAPVGDVTGDGEVTYRDLSGVLSHFGLKSESQASQCLDIDRDGSIDRTDALHVLHLSEPASDSCRQALRTLDEFVIDQKACSVDSDCAPFDAGCSHVADHCARVVYLKADTDAAALQSMAEAASDCLPPNACRRCEDPPPQGICVAGMCSPP